MHCKNIRAEFFKYDSVPDDDEPGRASGIVISEKKIG